VATNHTAQGTAGQQTSGQRHKQLLPRLCQLLMCREGMREYSRIARHVMLPFKGGMGMLCLGCCSRLI
jgi:hypothetical protein